MVESQLNKSIGIGEGVNETYTGYMVISVYFVYSKIPSPSKNHFGILV